VVPNPLRIIYEIVLGSVSTPSHTRRPPRPMIMARRDGFPKVDGIGTSLGVMSTTASDLMPLLILNELKEMTMANALLVRPRPRCSLVSR
jgi:hypothetical protein